MDNAVFLEFGLMLALAAVVATVVKILRQPMIISYIATGIIIGPQLLGYFSAGETGELLARFGVALLLFIIGIGLNPKVIRDVGKVALLAGVGQVSITTAAGYGLAGLLGFNSIESFYIGFALALSSTIIALKIMSDKRQTTRLYARIVTGVLLVQDVIATILLIVVAGGGDLAIGSQLVRTAGYGFGLALLLVLIGTFILPRIRKFVSSSQEYLFLFALAWGFGIASLFALAGLSIEVGALFAGVALASQPYAQEVSSRLRPLRDFFVMLFFIILGSQLEPASLGSVIVPVVALSALVVIGNPIIVMALMGLLGYTKRTGFQAGLTVAQISEFSLVLVILGQQLGRIDQRIVSIVTVVGLLTIGLSTYMMLFDEKLFRGLEKYLSVFERRKVRAERQQARDPEVILFGYTHGGKELVSLFEKLGREYLVVDYNPSVIDELNEAGRAFAYGDANDPELLQELNLENAKMVISTVTDYRTNLFLTTQTRAANSRATIIVHGERPDQAMHLYEDGATYVMMPRYIGSERISHMISQSGFKKSDFEEARQHHLAYVQHHLS
jgi:Kef-type K+ transport system membrane component KefB